MFIADIRDKRNLFCGNSTNYTVTDENYVSFFN